MRAADLTKQLLAFSRKLIITVRPVQMNVLIEALERWLRRILGEDVRLTLSLDPKLGLLRADPGLPRELLDDDWPADRSLSIYRALRAQTTEPAAREFAALIERSPRARVVAS